MIDGLLAPRATDTNPWLMPVMSASRGALHGARRQLYPKRTIWVDTAAETSGDGSYTSPLKRLADVFADDTLECVCRALCADKITVRVRGNLSATIGNGVTNSQSSIFDLIDGKERDYARHLVIRPWTKGNRLLVRCTCQIPVTVTTNTRIILTQSINLVKGLHGVKWMDTDFEVLLRIICDKEPTSLQISALAEIAGLYQCNDSILMNCTFEIKTLIDVLWRDPVRDELPKPPDEGEDDGGGGAGGGGGSGDGGGGDGGGGGSYPWPPIPAPEPPDDYPWPPGPVVPAPPGFDWDGVVNAASVVYALRECSGATIRGGSCNLLSRSMSNLGTRAECYGLFACPDSDVGGFVANVEAKAESSGSGAAYSNSSGHGVSGYSLTAQAVTSAFSGCADSLLESCRADAKSSALCNAGNTPYHAGTDGATKTGKVGGFAQ
ncbi:MAG: hypothetical protein M0P55_15450, partial [Clostridiales bacterium]|nr:hypothetical protein [Clostridiales bacterium]